MPASGKPWVIAQLTGARRALVLEGWSGPFGRPRQKPLVKDILELRQQKTRYPDSFSAPTRHVFGPNWEPWELNGRWMDKVLGPGGANQRAREVDRMIIEAQTVRVSWGDVLSVRGMLTKLEKDRESDAEIAWVLHIDVDSDDLQPDPTWRPPIRPPPIVVGILDKWTMATSFPVDAELRAGLLDMLDDAISVVTGAFGQLAVFASEVQDFENALLSDVNRLRQGILQAVTALDIVMDMVAPIESLTEQTAADAISVTGEDQAKRDIYRAQMETVLAAIMAQLAELDAAAEQASIRTSSAVTATQFDTWEGISARAYGDVSHADAIRRANGISYGSPPVAGTRYLLP